MGSHPVAGILTRKQNRDRHNQRKHHVTMEAERDWSDESVSQGMPRIAGHPEKLRRDKDPPLEPQRKHALDCTLISDC